MNTTQIIKFSTDEKHTKLLNFMRAWSKRKQDRQEQVRKDFKEGKYDVVINKLREKKS